jgi:TonB family protein
MCSVAQRVTLRLCLAVFLLVIPSTTKSQSTELILDRVDEGKLNLLASQTAQKIREAPIEDAQPSVLVIDFFRNSPGTPSRLGSLLADHFSESLSAYSNGMKIVDRKILKDYLTKEWTTLENLQSNDVCLRIGRQLGAMGVIVGTLSEKEDSVTLTLKIEGLGLNAKIEDPFPRSGTTAVLLLNEDLRRMFSEPGPNYARKPDEIPQEPGVFRSGPGVTPPTCDKCSPPDYSDAARAAKFQGNVTLSLVVTPDGQVNSILVVKGAPFGLTSKAIEAVQRWHFKPGLKDGMPVAVRVEVESSWTVY